MSSSQNRTERRHIENLEGRLRRLLDVEIPKTKRAEVLSFKLGEAAALRWAIDELRGQRGWL